VAAIEMFIKGTCPYCIGARRLLASKGQTWDEVDLGEHPERREEMVRRSGRTTVPQIWIDGRHVGGFDDLSALDATGELDRLLGGAG
jgi:glutaredoxin 3